MNEQDATEWDDLRAQLETMVVARDGWKRRCYEAETERDQLRADLAAMTERAEKAERERNEARHLLLRRVEASRLDEALSERDTARAELQAAKNLIEIARELLQHVRGGMWEKTLAAFDARQKTTGGSGSGVADAGTADRLKPGTPQPDPASLSQPRPIDVALGPPLQFDSKGAFASETDAQPGVVQAAVSIVADVAWESRDFYSFATGLRKRLGKGGG